jgi:hypothetical protein
MEIKMMRQLLAKTSSAKFYQNPFSSFGDITQTDE